MIQFLMDMHKLDSNAAVYILFYLFLFLFMTELYNIYFYYSNAFCSIMQDRNLTAPKIA